MSESPISFDPNVLNIGACGVCEDLGTRCVEARERCPRPAVQEERKKDPNWPFTVVLAASAPRHDRAGTFHVPVHIGDFRNAMHYAKVEVMTWTGCNGVRCGSQCGPGHSVGLWVPCQFAVGFGRSHHLSDKEISALRDALRILP